MAKTITTKTYEEVDAAMDELMAAQKAFEDAVYKFHTVFNPNGVSLDGLIEDIDETMSEIVDCIQETFEHD